MSPKIKNVTNGTCYNGSITLDYPAFDVLPNPKTIVSSLSEFNYTEAEEAQIYGAFFYGHSCINRRKQPHLPNSTNI